MQNQVESMSFTEVIQISNLSHSVRDRADQNFENDDFITGFKWSKFKNFIFQDKKSKLRIVSTCLKKVGFLGKIVVSLDILSPPCVGRIKREVQYISQ